MKGRSEQGQKQAEYGFIHAVKVRLGPTFSVYPIDPYPMRSLLVASILALSGGTLVAQWNPNTAVNTPVATGTTDDLEAITGPSGRTYVVMFQPTTSGYSPRLQVLNGQGVPRLGTNGMQFNTTTSMSTYTVTWDMRLDAQEHVYIGFTGTGNTDAVVHRLDSTGNHVWSPSGVALGQGYDVKLLPLANGDVMTGWIDASAAAAAAMEALITETNAIPLIEFDGDTFVDYRARRPLMQLRDGVITKLDWSAPRIMVGHDANNEPILLLTGPEPDSRWQHFAQCVVELSEKLNVRRMLGMGAYPIATPHTRAVKISCTSPDAHLSSLLPFIKSSVLECRILAAFGIL